MAPPPEYDKEPKAPDKNVTTPCGDESKDLYSTVKDQPANPDHRGSAAAANAEAENNKYVETLDDGQLRALLDEAITYKCPKDREGKSSLFKELLHEVEQDEQQASEAARGLSAGRAARRRGGAAGARRELQSNSLQDLVAAMAAEPAPRRTRTHHAHHSHHSHQPHHAQVSARTHHGGSLPSGVDTSFLLSEEPAARGGYLATVRCVNPPPLAERRVSASDANGPVDVDLLARRSKPTYPMTYTARATLEIGSGSVCSGRAVTTTTASNQVRTTPVTAPRQPCRNYPAAAPAPRANTRCEHPRSDTITGQMKLMNAIRPKQYYDTPIVDGGGIQCKDKIGPVPEGNKFGVPRGQLQSNDLRLAQEKKTNNQKTASRYDYMHQYWENSVHNWYEGLNSMQPLLNSFMLTNARTNTNKSPDMAPTVNTRGASSTATEKIDQKSSNHYSDYGTYNIPNSSYIDDDYMDQVNPIPSRPSPATLDMVCNTKDDEYDRKKYRDHVGYDLTSPRKFSSLPRFFKKTSIAVQNSSLQSNTLCENSTNITYKTNNQTFHESKINKDKNTSVTSDISENCLASNIVNSEKLFEVQNEGQMSEMEVPKNECTNLHCMDSTERHSSELSVNSSHDMSSPVPVISLVDLEAVYSKPCEPKDTCKNENDLTGVQPDMAKSGNELQSTMSYPTESSTEDIFKQDTLKSKTKELIENETLAKTRNNRIIHKNLENSDLPILSESVHKESFKKECAEISVKNQTKRDIVDAELNVVKSDKHQMSKLPTFDCDRVIKLQCFEQIPCESEKQITDICGDHVPNLTKSAFVVMSKETSTIDDDNGWENEIELMELQSYDEEITQSNDFLQHLAVQQRLLTSLENEANVKDSSDDECLLLSNEKEDDQMITVEKIGVTGKIEAKIKSSNMTDNTEHSTFEENMLVCKEHINEPTDKVAFAEQNNAYLFLTLPQSFFLLSQKYNNKNVPLKQLESNNNFSPYTSGENKIENKGSRKKGKHKKDTPENNAKRRNAANKNTLKLLLYSDSTEKSVSSPGVSFSRDNEVDSAIPFTCITTPEVVASCNTTSSTNQSAIVIDPKPLQLSSCYRAVASLTGAWPPASSPPATSTAATDAPATTSAPPSAPVADITPVSAAPAQQSRSVIASNFNGLPLSRPTYGTVAPIAADEYKVPILTVHYRLQKSLDENGNAVQAFSSPLSGSSQHKKPRRKKSPKNETVIKSHQIDGYQGNKDLNEVLRFIESNADNARGHKLGRAKHKDDSDDKGGKKRSTERRKDKENKVKRASSLEELSRTKLEDLTAAPAAPAPAPASATTVAATPNTTTTTTIAAAVTQRTQARADPAPAKPAKPERRSWGEDARDTFYFRDEAASASTAAAAATGAELTDFQTVTKKRKPRRRHDDAAADPPRRTRAPSPRRPPSDRSNDSNDDLDSVHSLPADARAPPPAPHASYADIARTRHNIPDLIESCNFYAEGEPPAAPPPPEGDYPALTTRRANEPLPTPAAPTVGGGGANAGAGSGPGTGTRVRKGRGGAGAPPPPPPPAPDVVADRRPPVVLLEAGARPRDMDGVTFGFDVNEQLLGGAARRGRCDLVRDAPDGVPVRAGCAALRYVPPRAHPSAAHLLQIIDYVGGAWEDVVKCAGGKVCYFSE